MKILWIILAHVFLLSRVLVRTEISKSCTILKRIQHWKSRVPRKATHPKAMTSGFLSLTEQETQGHQEKYTEWRAREKTRNKQVVKALMKRDTGKKTN